MPAVLHLSLRLCRCLGRTPHYISLYCLSSFFICLRFIGSKNQAYVIRGGPILCSINSSCYHMVCEVMKCGGENFPLFQIAVDN